MKMLLPVDGSADALAAVRHALALRAAGLDAAVVLVNVQEPPSLYEVVAAHDREVLDHLRADAGADLLAPAEALLTAAGVPWESEVAGGQPATLLIELLENYGCQLVILGARGIGSPGDGGLGSVAQAVVARCPVPVTLVRAPADDEAGRTSDTSPDPA